jgi:putative ubiquitin-RnfH superfamily antitoxin RatB of RatAB toxin-antitoxin module
MVNIEIAYASVEQQTLLRLQVLGNTTIKAAITQSSILNQYPEIDLTINKVGIYNKLVSSLEQFVKEGDRIEIYRLLANDPIEARRRRTEKKRR